MELYPKRKPMNYKFSYKKICSICNKKFVAPFIRQNLCSFDCRQIHQRERSLLIKRLKEGNCSYPPCEVCKDKVSNEIHTEKGKNYFLCSKHHAIITGGIKTIEQLLLIKVE